MAQGGVPSWWFPNENFGLRILDDGTLELVALNGVVALSILPDGTLVGGNLLFKELAPGVDPHDAATVSQLGGGGGGGATGPTGPQGPQGATGPSGLMSATDGVTTVSPVEELDFPSGVTIADLGGGVASVAPWPLFMEAISGSPVGVVTPTGPGYMIQDSTNGAVFIAVATTSADWVQIGGRPPGGFGPYTDVGVATDQSGSTWVIGKGASAGYAGFSDTLALGPGGTGNGIVWVCYGPDGSQAAAIQLGIVGDSKIHVWNPDGSYQFPAALTGASWGILPDGSEYLIAIPAPADGDVATSERVQWYDDTVGYPKVLFKERDSGGTLFSGISAVLNMLNVFKLRNISAADAAAALDPSQYTTWLDDTVGAPVFHIVAQDSAGTPFGAAIPLGAL